MDSYQSNDPNAWQQHQTPAALQPCVRVSGQKEAVASVVPLWCWGGAWCGMCTYLCRHGQKRREGFHREIVRKRLVQRILKWRHVPERHGGFNIACDLTLLSASTASPSTHQDWLRCCEQRVSRQFVSYLALRSAFKSLASGRRICGGYH